MKFFLMASFPDSIVGFRGSLISELQTRGMQVHVAAPDLLPGSSARAELEARGLKVHHIALQRTGTNPLADLAFLMRLWWLLLRVRPDFFMGYTIKPVIYGSLAAWLARVPKRFALITGLGYAFQGDGQRDALQGFVQRLYAAALGTTDLVFFQNPDDLTLFRTRSILKSHAPALVVNGSGIDVARFESKPLPNGPMHFLLIARLLGDKGVREYAQAARTIKRTHPEARFSLVGWIDSNPNSISQSELDAWVADGSIEFLGRMSDVRPAIESCSVYVLPSYREGTPRTVLEAMAMGRPIITTDAPGCRETVVNDENGLLVPVKSADALNIAMRRFLNEPTLAARMGKRAREIAEEKYDVHKVNAVMLNAMGIH